MALSDVSKALNDVNHEGGRTNTGRALTFMESYFKTVPYSQGSTYLIVITAGESEDSVTRPAEKIRAQGVMVFAVGVKRSNKAQLQEISGDPDRTFKVRDYYFLQWIKNDILRPICGPAGEETSRDISLKVNALHMAHCFYQHVRLHNFSGLSPVQAVMEYKVSKKT